MDASGHAERTVSEALASFRPVRRTANEPVELARLAGRVPASTPTATAPIPSFRRAALDGYAVRAADTAAASAERPCTLRVAGSVAMGAYAVAPLAPGEAVAVSTGAAIPAGADAVARLEWLVADGESIELRSPLAAGEAIVGVGEDVAAGDLLVEGGRPLRAGEVALLAAAGVTTLAVHARPRVAIVSTGDELVDASGNPGPGQVRDATGPALAALVAQAGGEPDLRGIVRDDPGALRRALADAVASTDAVVVSAGASAGARDLTYAAIASLGDPGPWCRGLALRPGRPTVLATIGDVPVLGLPGNPQSALAVFRLIGMQVVRELGGWTSPPPLAHRTLPLAADVPSAQGRFDLVQVRIADEMAQPFPLRATLLAPLARADGVLAVPEHVSGYRSGSLVEVELYS